MIKITRFFKFALVATILSCGEGNNTEQIEENYEGDNVTLEEGIVLEKAYATHISRPYNKTSVYKTLDGDPNTRWESEQGCGLGEGLLFRFENQVKISKVEVESETTDGFAEIKSISTFCDGIKRYPYDINSEVTTLFIRIDDIYGTKTKKKSDTDGLHKQSYQDESKKVGIKEVLFFDYNGNKIDLLLPKHRDATLKASTTLVPRESHDVMNIYDGDESSAWAEGSFGTGEGQHITFSFIEKTPVVGIKTWNGNQRSAKHYHDNARIKSFSFGPKDGKQTIYELPDNKIPQLTFLNEPLNDAEYVFKIISTYPGDKHEALYLSDIVLFQEQKAIEIRNKKRESLIGRNKKNAPALLETVLDKQISIETTTQSEEDNQHYISMLLRSDNTFMYSSSSYSSKQNNSADVYTRDEEIAEGNWELQSSADGKVRIRVFGKLYTLRHKNTPYNSITTKEKARVFQDYLYITEGKISTQHFLKPLILINN